MKRYTQVSQQHPSQLYVQLMKQLEEDLQRVLVKKLFDPNVDALYYNSNQMLQNSLENQ